MKYYLGADGGGSKLNLLLYDEDFRPIANGLGGGITTSYAELSVVEQNMQNAVDSLMKAVNGERLKIERFSGVVVGPGNILKEKLDKVLDIPAYEGFDEGYCYLLAGGLTDKGGVALSGTGNGTVYINGRNDIYHCGGYGSYMGEDGSGWWIGNRGMFAVIQQIDGWGPDTLLYPYLLEYLGITDRRKLIGAVYFNKQYHHHQLIAGFARYVGKAAREGDACAIAILKEAGVLLAKQMIGCYKIKNAAFEEFPVFACGGAWKASPIMLDAHNEYLASHGKPATQMALFDPIIGPMVQQILDRGENPQDYRQKLIDLYPDNIIKVV